MDYKKKDTRKNLKKMVDLLQGGELVNSNIPTIYLTRMVEAGELVREERGVYLSAKGDYDEYYFFQNSIKLQSSRMYLLCIYFNLQTSFLQN